MSRYIGNYVRVPSTEPAQGSAPGVWSLSEQLAYQRNNQWPVARDPYYNQTVLHLSGNIPNVSGPQAMNVPLAYNSDASSNNFLITPNGDVSPRPFSPYMGGNYSVFFDGSDDYIASGANNLSMQFGTGAYTVEFWVYQTSLKNDAFVIGGSGTLFQLGFYSTGLIQASLAGVAGFGSATIVVPINQWVHVALVRSSTAANGGSYYINGQFAGYFTDSYNHSSAISTINIGTTNAGSATYTFPGYISNLRIAKSAIYTSGFTPSTSPFTTSSQGATNVTLLACQSNRFIDNSSSPNALTPVNGPRVTDNSPFVSADFTTGAGYFDGTTDWLSAPDSTAYTMGAGDFTVEAWVYCTAADFASSRYIVAQRNSSADTSISFAINFIGGGFKKVRLLCFDSGGSSYEAVCATDVLNLNAWTHIAGVRDGATLRIYVNGVQQGTANISTASLVDSNGSVAIGRLGDADALYWLGYISNVRVTKGGCLYPSGTQFTPPTAPLTTNVSAGTVSLLTLQTRAPSQNHGFIDSSPNEFIVTRNGNVSQGTFSPFSPTGWGNYLPNQQNNTVNFTTSAGTSFQFSGDFTIEGWVYPENNSGDGSLFVVSDNTNYLALNISISANVFNIYLNSGTPSAVITSDIPPAAWTHIAMVRSGSATNNIKLYVNGVLKGSTTNTSTLGYANPAVSRIGGGVGGINRYYSNVRVCKSAVYTAAFTPSTLPLTTTSQSATNCVLLAANSNRFANQAAGATATITGTPSVQAFSPFAPATQSSPLVTGGSGYFDGNGAWLNPNATSANLALGSGDFTIEFWLYTSRGATRQYIFDFRNNGSTGAISPMTAPLLIWGDDGADNNGNWLRYIALSNSSIVANADLLGVTLSTLSNQWNHIAIVRSSGTVYGYLNGVRKNSVADSTNYNVNCSVSVSAAYTGGANYLGNINGFRVVKGTAVYSGTNFPIPTAPPTAIPGTSLLLNFTAGGIVDATGRNVIETVGNAQITINQAKWDFQKGGGSLRFDGDVDQIKFPASPLYALGTGDFTIELWAYSLETGSSQRGMVDFRSAAVGTNGLMLRENSGGFLVWTNSGAVITTTTGRTANQWQHVALVRASGTLSLYVDGLFQTSAPYTTNLTDTQLRISGFVDTAATPYAYLGNMNNVRVTRRARYSGTSTSTPNFTLPTGPFAIG